MRDDDNLDLLLNSALATYGDPGPNSGLEERILAQRIPAQRIPARVFISAQSPHGPVRRWLPWTIALAAAACLFLIAVFSVPRRVNPPVDHASQAHGAQQPPIAANPSQSPQRLATSHSAMTSALKPHLPHGHAAANSASLLKRDVFPTPQPLTRQEQALAVFAIHTPALELQALIEARKQDDAPVSITAIDIQPLDPPDRGGN